MVWGDVLKGGNHFSTSPDKEVIQKSGLAVGNVVWMSRYPSMEETVTVSIVLVMRRFLVVLQEWES